MASAQYLTQLACALAARGHDVTVVTSRRAYDDPATQFPARETWRGITIHRVASTAFGKGAKWRRAADFASFMISCCARLALLPRHDVVVALTSPPLISFIGAWLARLRGSRFVYWVMDFNPDEAIAAGWLRPGSFAARLLDRMSRFSLRRAHKIIALDRFMRDRIVAKGVRAEKVVVLPPWSQDDQVRYHAAGRERFRAQHGLQGKFVVMYSGNHSPIHPLDTLLEAAKRLAGERNVVFCFVGGGSEFQRVQRLAGEGIRKASDTEAPLTPALSMVSTPSPRPSPPLGERVSEGRVRGSPQIRQKKTSNIQHPASDVEGAEGTSNIEHRTSNVAQLPNLLCLPYQPLDQLSASLSAADVHVVVMGNAFVGLVHPCKIYNILAVGAPVLYVGPQPSHVTEILDAMQGEHPSACAAHGEVELLIQSIQRFRQLSKGTSCQKPPSALLGCSRETLLPRLIAELESA